MNFNQTVSELESVRIGMCWNTQVSQSQSDEIGKCQNIHLLHVQILTSPATAVHFKRSCQPFTEPAAAVNELRRLISCQNLKEFE